MTLDSERILPGNSVTLTFRNYVNGALTAATVNWYRRPEGGSLESLGTSTSNPSTGVYTYRYQFSIDDAPGKYYFAADAPSVENYEEALVVVERPHVRPTILPA